MFVTSNKLIHKSLNVKCNILIFTTSDSLLLADITFLETPTTHCQGPKCYFLKHVVEYIKNISFSMIEKSRLYECANIFISKVSYLTEKSILSVYWRLHASTSQLHIWPQLTFKLAVMSQSNFVHPCLNWAQRNFWPFSRVELCTNIQVT